MADRSFNDPEKRDEYRRQLENERNLPPRQGLQPGPPISPRPRRGSGAMWWWLLFLAVIIACIWLIPWGGRRNTGTNPGVRQAAGTPMPNNANGTNNAGYNTNPAHSATPQPTTVGDLTSNPKSFEGTKVLLRKATVEQRLGNAAVIVGPGNGTASGAKSVTVLLPANQASADLRHGAKVQITGTLTAAPANNDNLGLSNTEAQHVRQQGFYLRASAIAPTSTAENSGGGGGR
ncbi:MAG: hypothetical protein WAM79_21215 [Candidatus Sulfotelmatobacter sp.]